MKEEKIGTREVSVGFPFLLSNPSWSQKPQVTDYQDKPKSFLVNFLTWRSKQERSPFSVFGGKKK